MSRHGWPVLLLRSMGIILVGCGAHGDPRPAERNPAPADQRLTLPLAASSPVHRVSARAPTAVPATASRGALAMAGETDERPARPESDSAARTSPDEPTEPNIVWRFRSAAPVTGAPAVSPAGLVYVATVEGYVHALEPDGAFRWSYGLRGIPIGSPAVDAAGRIYVATSDQRLYALSSEGRLGWQQRSRTRFATPPIWVAPGFVYYVGRDRALYHVAEWNSVPSARPLGQPVIAPLSSLGEGLVAVGTTAPDAQVFRRSSQVASLALESSLLQPLLGGKAHWFAVTSAGLSAFDVATRALAWSRPARRAGASADERTLVAEVDGELVWLAPHTGLELQRVPLTGDVSAPPVVTNAGIAVVPMVSGELLVIEPRSGRRARVALARAPAWSPVWSERTSRITGAAGGMVVGLDLSAWSRALEEHESPLDAAPVDPGIHPGNDADHDPAGSPRFGSAGTRRGSAG
jgi:hypothetical protein